MYFVVFSTSLNWGRTSNGVELDSIKCSIPERGLDGAWSCWVLGHNSAGRSLKTSFIARSKDQISVSVSKSDTLFIWGRFGWNSSILIGWVLTGIKLGSSGWMGTGVWTTWGDFLALLHLPKSIWDWEVLEEEEGVIDRLLFLYECLDLFEFFFRLDEFKESDLEVEEEEEDDRCLLFFDLWSLLDCSLREGLVWETSVEMGGSMITLGSDICEKSGLSGINCLEEVAEFGNSDISECSYPGVCTFGSLRILPWNKWLLINWVWKSYANDWWLVPGWPVPGWPVTGWPVSDWPVSGWPVSDWPVTVWPVTGWPVICCLVTCWLADRWLVDRWYVDRWLVDRWTVDRWLVDRWLVDRWCDWWTKCLVGL